MNTYRARSKNTINNDLLECIDKTFPIPPRFLSALKYDIADLSRLLTSERPERREGYLSEPRFLSAYLRYFLPWNIIRLCAIFSEPDVAALLTEKLSPKNGLPQEVLDLGSGPLTAPLALWTAFPALRSAPISVTAVDGVRSVLAAGKKLMLSYTGSDCPWKLALRQARFDAKCESSKAAFVTAVNVLNEIFAKTAQADVAALSAAADKCAARLIRAAAPDGVILVAEPGVPRSAQFLSLLKKSFESSGLKILFPCPDGAACSMPGGAKGSKWCHWTIDADGAPERLRKLTGEAVGTKEKLTFSYLLAGRADEAAPPAPPSTEARGGAFKTRVVSAAFPLPGGAVGRYGCSRHGLVLLTGSAEAQARLSSHSLITISESGGRDRKTGALVAPLPSAGNAIPTR